MKYLLLFISAFLSLQCMCQNPPNKIDESRLKQYKLNPLGETDTSFKIIYVDRSKPKNEVGYFFNGKFTDRSLLNTLNTNAIEKVDVKRDSMWINKVLYRGLIYFKIKDSYNLKIISFADLKEKYGLQKNRSSILMINGELITSDFDNYLFDENNILTIKIDSIKNIMENIDIGVIEILTRSAKNIEDRNKIIIRGENL